MRHVCLQKIMLYLCSIYLGFYFSHFVEILAVYKQLICSLQYLQKHLNLRLRHLFIIQLPRFYLLPRLEMFTDFNSNKKIISAKNKINIPNDVRV